MAQREMTRPLYFLQKRLWVKINVSLNILQSLRIENSVEHHFIGFSKKVHRSPEDFKSLRLQMAHKALLGIPFLKKTEFIFVIHILTTVTAPAALFCPYGSDQ